MLNAYLCLVDEHDPKLVGLAAVICLLATFAAVALFDHARRSRGGNRPLWLVIAALAGGTGIWTTHFIAMLAFETDVPASYDGVATVCLLLASVLFTGAGFAITLQRPGRRQALLGGAVLGAGIAAMHYGGMAAYRVDGEIGWDPALIAVSVLVGVVLAAVAVDLGRSSRLRDRGLSAAALTAAICGTHVIGMGAITIRPHHSLLAVSGPPPLFLVLPVTLASMFVIVLAIIGLSADLRLRRRAERERMSSLADAAVEGLLICDGQRIITGNSSFGALTGFGRDELAGMALSHCFPDRSAIDGMLSTPDRLIETQLTMSDGETIPVEIIPHLIEFAGRRHHAVAVRDLRARKLAEDRIRFLAHHDVLTGLPNRGLFETRLDDAIEAAQRRGRELAILCLDLDRFKEINDLFGHHAGDEALRSVSRVLAERLRSAETAARVGGDEFAVILPEAGRTGAESIAANIIERLSRLDAERSAGPEIATSIGIAMFPADGDDRASLLAAADTALYRAKAEGRGTVRFYEASMAFAVRERRRLEHELRSAIGRGEMSLVYQPQLSVGTGTLVGFEALLRWHHPERGFISPALFIPIAEESGAIMSIGEWVLRTACAEATTWTNPLRVAVNVSAVQLHAAAFAGFVADVLAETGIAPGRLELEITETALIRDIDRALATLRKLKALGVKIAMDDFGTGYSSLSNLRAFPFDRIKIDGSFIQSVDSNSQAAAIVRAILELGRSLDLPILAEGVETDAELDFLGAEFCQEVQGYLLGRPAAIETFAPLTRRQEAAQTCGVVTARAGTA